MKSNYNLLHLRYGVKNLFTSNWKWLFLLVYALLSVLVFHHRYDILQYIQHMPFQQLYKVLIDILYSLFCLIGLGYLLIRFGTPFGTEKITNHLHEIGLVNNANECPVLIEKYKDQKTNHVVYVFETRGISIRQFENHKDGLQWALKRQIGSMEYGKKIRTIKVHTISPSSRIPDKCYWKNEFLRTEDFELVLGEGLNGKEIIDLTKTPHVLCGGSTGSGKTILLKSLLMQAVRKQARVYIADFKGGVDYTPIWHEKCKIITEREELLKFLTKLINTLEERKKLFKQANCSNIKEFNNVAQQRLPYIVFACDEVAEVLDKTGLNKQEKEVVLQIESMLSTIARQSRAFGIHTILATQRPSADILTGQVKNNMDIRICGKADSILSKIILDNTDASTEIPKNSQGRFITNEGIVFQGYLFSDEDLIT